MNIDQLEQKLGIAGLNDAEKLALVKTIESNVQASKQAVKSQEAGQYASLVVEAIKKIKKDLEDRFSELSGIIDVKSKDIKNGVDGKDGKDGKDGVDGKDGKDGLSITGPKGEDGKDGEDGVGVQDAHIDFDGSLIITLTNGKELNVGEVVPFDVAEKIKVIGNGGGTSQSVLDTLTSLQDQINTLTGIDGVLGTIAQQDYNNVSITGGAIDGTAIGAAVPATGVFTTLKVNGTGGATGLAIGQDSGATFNSERLFFEGTSGTVAIYNAANTINFTTSATTGSSTGTQQFRISPTASAVNYVQVTGAATGLPPVISAQGSDALPNLAFQVKGGAAFNFYSQGGLSYRHFRIDGTGNAVNAFQVNGSVATQSPVMSVLGTDTNISQVFQSKGTGAIDLAAGSSGVNISNGGTVTAITRTAAGSGYTSIPSVVITAPTTAGGVQATMSVGGIGCVGITSVASGGSGYLVGDVLTLVGGTSTTACQITVTAVSGGAVTGGSSSGGVYSVAPTNPVSVTGGSGTGCTLNLTFGVTSNQTITITNAGSGYVEQPTVSFSGGGGSGAAAYATVGSGTVIRSLAQTVDFYVPDGIGFRVSGTASSGGAYLTAFASATTPILRGIGSGTFAIQAASAIPIQFQTNASSSAVEQFRVAHTASAVNYVQVTGAATGGAPTISAQGSDAASSLIITSKGGGDAFFRTGSTGGFIRLQPNAVDGFQVSGVASGVNYLRATNAIATASPILSAQGSDTNIDLSLTPKGTGSVVVSSNNMLVGTATASLVTGISAARLSVSGSGDGITVVSGAGNDTINVAKSGTPSGTWIGFFSSAGTGYGNITVNGAGTAYNTTSDYRLKNIDGPLVGAKDFILALKPKQGTWKADGSKFVGFIADEFQQVSPTSVTGEKDAVDEEGKPIYQTMQASSSEVMANLIALVQEQQAVIEQLKADVAKLKAV